MLQEPRITVLGPDPAHRKHAINGNAFQQDAITSCNGWQYAVFYSALAPEEAPEPLYVHLARRQLPDGPWEVLALQDYPQTTDDGHNTVQMGICPGDGTIHLSYDHHCDILRYRHSVRNLASDPAAFRWDAALFTPTLDHLPGLPSTHQPFHYVTYPRFGPLGPDLFASLRDGKAGLGNDHLYLYRAAAGRWHRVGAAPLLTGVRSNPYVHGWDWEPPRPGHHAQQQQGQQDQDQQQPPGTDGRLHATWVYRGFVWYPGWDDPLDAQHKQQAGPNGAENNHNLCYAYSDGGGDRGGEGDGGPGEEGEEEEEESSQWTTWRNGRGEVVADLRRGETIANDAPGIAAFLIPRGSGLSNQEAQAVDREGGVHVLNRDTLDGGRYLWKHFYRDPADGTWSSRAIRPIDGPRRGRLAVSKGGSLFILLPETTSPTLRILRASKASGYAAYEEVWVGRGLAGEPLVDGPRLALDNVLSVFVRQDVEGSGGGRNVVVLDFQL